MNENIYFFQQNTLAQRSSLRIAIIGQSAFAVDVLHRLRQHGHVIVGIFTILDKGSKEDPLGKFSDQYFDCIRRISAFYMFYF